MSTELFRYSALTLLKENKIAFIFLFFRESSLSNRLNLHLNVHNFHSDRYWERSVPVLYINFIIRIACTRAKKGLEESCAQQLLTC